MTQSRERDDKLIYQAALAQDQKAIDEIKARSSVNVTFGDYPVLTQLATQGEKEQKAIDFLLKNGANPFHYALGLGLGGHVQLARKLRDSFAHPLDQQRIWGSFIEGYAQTECEDLDERITENPGKFILRCRATRGLARQGKLEESRLNSWLKDAYNDDVDVEQAHKLLIIAIAEYAKAANLHKCQLILEKAKHSKQRAMLLAIQSQCMASSHSAQELLPNTNDPAVKLERFLQSALGFCCVGNLPAAIDSYHQANKECGPSFAESKSHFLKNMICHSAKWGHIANSVEISKLAEPSQQPILAICMAQGLAEANMDADQILDLIKPPLEQRRRICQMIAFGYASTGTTINVSNLLKRRGILHGILEPIIIGYATENCSTAAIQLINDFIHDEQQRTDAISYLIKKLIENGYISQAASIFRQYEHDPQLLKSIDWTLFLPPHSPDDILKKFIKCPDSTFLTAVANKAEESKDFKDAKEKPDLKAITLSSQKINQARQLHSINFNQAHAASDQKVRCMLIYCMDTSRVSASLFRLMLSFLLPEKLEETEIKELAEKLKWHLGVKQPVIIALQKYSAFSHPSHITSDTSKLIEECKKAKTPSDLVKALPDAKSFDAENKGFTGVARQITRLRSLG